MSLSRPGRGPNLRMSSLNAQPPKAAGMSLGQWALQLGPEGTIATGFCKVLEANWRSFQCRMALQTVAPGAVSPLYHPPEDLNQIKLLPSVVTPVSHSAPA